VTPCSLDSKRTAAAVVPFSRSQRPLSIVITSAPKVYGAFLDASKAFDKVLHNGLFRTRIKRNVPVGFVKLLKNWYSRLSCMVRWNGKLGTAFPILCGVRQGGILSPFLFAIYVDDLISSLRQCGYGVNIGNLFVAVSSTPTI